MGGSYGAAPSPGSFGGAGILYIRCRSGGKYKILQDFFFSFRYFGGCGSKAQPAPHSPKKIPPLRYPLSPPTPQPGPGCRAVPGDAARSLGRVITHLLIPPACSCSKPPGSRRVGGEVSGPPPRFRAGRCLPSGLLSAAGAGTSSPPPARRCPPPEERKRRGKNR